MSIKKSNFSNNTFFMNLALAQAQKNLGNTKENPAVGCVVVKNNCVIGAGSTSINGRPHAEQNAIKFSRYSVNKANLYITLEPCSHYGKTEPCVQAIAKNKIKNVFFSINDPDVRSYKKCKKYLKKHNIKVQMGILEYKIKNFYKSYFKYKSDNIPFVSAKIAMSKDFYLSSKKNKWITNNFSRGRVHLMRSYHDCILTSSKTIIADNPMLNCRIAGLENNSPTRFIIDKRLKIPINSNIVKSAKRYRTFIFFNKTNTKKIKLLKRLNIKVIKFPLNTDGNFNLKKILIKIKQLGFSRVFLESGLKLSTNFLHDRLIDDFYLFISRKDLGTYGRISFKENIKLFLKKRKFIKEKVNLFGDKLFLYRIK